jgi:putrescine aminotransferase
MLSTGRKHFIGMIGAFHGKTFGALSATSKACFRKPFVQGSLLGNLGNNSLINLAHAGLLEFTHVPPNDCDALRRAFDAAAFTGNEIAGLIVEPVLGEGGIHVLTDEYMRLARQLCDEAGARLICDEVQVWHVTIIKSALLFTTFEDWAWPHWSHVGV